VVWIPEKAWYDATKKHTEKYKNSNVKCKGIVTGFKATEGTYTVEYVVGGRNYFSYAQLTKYQEMCTPSMEPDFE
jgi:hypothetical protein